MSAHLLSTRTGPPHFWEIWRRSRSDHLPGQVRRTAIRSLGMAEPIAIAHLTTEGGERLCGASGGPLALDVSAHVLNDGRWEDRTSVVRCGRCVEILTHAPMPV